MDKYIIRALRMNESLTQKELAGRLKISESTVAAYETGRRSVSANVRMKVSSLFEVTPEILETAERARKVDLMMG
jgi:transcriptional regulator with XRE-family HTH domain